MNYRPTGRHPQAALTDRILTAPLAPRPAACPQCAGYGRVVTAACTLQPCPSCRPEGR